MAKNGTSNNKYAFIDFYLLENLDKKYQDKECKKKFFNEKNFFYLQKITKHFL